MELLYNRLDKLVERQKELETLLSDVTVLNNRQKYQEYTKEHALVAEVLSQYDELKKVDEEIRSHTELLKEEQDEEFLVLVTKELESLKERQATLENEIKLLLIPKDKNDDRNTIVEIRAGTGGEEAALFAADLFRMYSKYAESQHWRIETLSTNPTGIGGFKEIIFSVDGRDVYRKLKYECGAHRVQRVPATETSGRIHTSAVTVAVLPEPEEVEVSIDPKDLRIDVFRSSGPGGQSVNTTDSAVRITHIPTEIVVSCQDEKSQHKNKTKAMRILKARLLDHLRSEQEREISRNRKAQVGSGDRSEKIRTYNFPQGRVTDHRAGLTLHKLTDILDGDLEEVISVLITQEYNKKLEEVS